MNKLISTLTITLLLTVLIAKAFPPENGWSGLVTSINTRVFFQYNHDPQNPRRGPVGLRGNDGIQGVAGSCTQRTQAFVNLITESPAGGGAPSQALRDQTFGCIMGCTIFMLSSQFESDPTTAANPRDPANITNNNNCYNYCLCECGRRALPNSAALLGPNGWCTGPIQPPPPNQGAVNNTDVQFFCSTDSFDEQNAIYNYYNNLLEATQNSVCGIDTLFQDDDPVTEPPPPDGPPPVEPTPTQPPPESTQTACPAGTVPCSATDDNGISQCNDSSDIGMTCTCDDPDKGIGNCHTVEVTDDNGDPITGGYVCCVGEPEPPQIVCGDGTCDPEEDCAICASDCGPCEIPTPGEPFTF